MKLSRMKLIWDRDIWNFLKYLKYRTGQGSNRALTTIHRQFGSAVSTTGQEQCIMDSCSINPNCREPRVVIIGAGMAGLSAAHRLSQCGINNYLVLEAKERYAVLRNLMYWNRKDYIYLT